MENRIEELKLEIEKIEVERNRLWKKKCFLEDEIDKLETESLEPLLGKFVEITDCRNPCIYMFIKKIDSYEHENIGTMYVLEGMFFRFDGTINEPVNFQWYENYRYDCSNFYNLNKFLNEDIRYITAEEFYETFNTVYSNMLYSINELIEFTKSYEN